MTATTPPGKPPAQAQPHQFSASVSALPLHTWSGSPAAGGPHPFSRSTNGFRHSQIRSTQPSYNLVAGQSLQTPPRHGGAASSRAGTPPNRASSLESLKENMAPPDAEAYEAQRRLIQELRAQVGTLSYRNETAKQEMEMAEARQAAELEDQRRRADDEYERAKVADMERQGVERTAELAREEVASLRERLDHETQQLEKRAREAEDENRVLREQVEELAVFRDEIVRNAEREAMDKSIKAEAAQRAAKELEAERAERESLLAKMQDELAERDSRIGHLEAENIRLKAQAGDADTMAIVRHELARIRALEASHRDQAAEFETLRQKAKRADIAEEEKRSLLRKLDTLSRTADELAEARIQRQRLEDERMEWESLLRNAGDDDLNRLNGPEAIVRKLMEERLARAQEVERVGGLRAALAGLEAKMKSLQDERAALAREMEAIKPKSATNAGAGGPDKARARLERQRALAVKEVEYLRLQLSSFDAEDSTFQPEAHDAARSERIKELESLVDQYRAEVLSLHTNLTAIEDAAATGLDPKPGNKRPRTDDPSQETRQPSSSSPSSSSSHASPSNLCKLQDEASGLRAQLAATLNDLASTRSQLATLRQRNKTRILTLRDNPTSAHEAIKQTTLNTLRRENAHLLSRLLSLSSSHHNDPSVPLIPQSVLDATLLTVQATQQQVASAEKTTRRLKEVWSAKSAEFREAIASTLGWSVSFMPNGKMRVESMFYPSQTDEHENSILFDGERGTMKVGGGPRSPFADKIGGHIKFWVRERGCIPGLLAALTLEFYEEGIAKEV